MEICIVVVFAFSPNISALLVVMSKGCASPLFIPSLQCVYSTNNGAFWPFFFFFLLLRLAFYVLLALT